MINFMNHKKFITIESSNYTLEIKWQDRKIPIITKIHIRSCTAYIYIYIISTQEQFDKPRATIHRTLTQFPHRALFPRRAARDRYYLRQTRETHARRRTLTSSWKRFFAGGWPIEPGKVPRATLISSCFDRRLW